MVMAWPNYVPQTSLPVGTLANAFPNAGFVTTIKTAKMERMNSTIAHPRIVNLENFLAGITSGTLPTAYHPTIDVTRISTVTTRVTSRIAITGNLIKMITNVNH